MKVVIEMDVFHTAHIPSMAQVVLESVMAGEMSGADENKYGKYSFTATAPVTEPPRWRRNRREGWPDA